MVSILHSVPFTLLFKLPQVERFGIKDWDIRVPRFSIIYLQVKSYALIKPSPRFEILLSLGRVLDYLFVATIALEWIYCELFKDSSPMSFLLINI